MIFSWERMTNKTDRRIQLILVKKRLLDTDFYIVKIPLSITKLASSLSIYKKIVLKHKLQQVRFYVCGYTGEQQIYYR